MNEKPKPRPSSGGIVLGPDGRLVIVEQHGNSWSFPKGGLEEGESELEAAVREIREETGISELSCVRALGSYDRYSIGKDGKSEMTELGLRTRTFFLFRTPQTALTPEDGEVTEARWTTVEEALTLLTHPADRAFLESVKDTLE